jgi:hypothetical protein
MFSGSSTGFLYRMNNGVSSDTANFTRTITFSDFPLPVPRESGQLFATTSFEALALYLKASASADSVTMTYYPDGSSTGITVKTFTQAHTGYAYKELRTETSSTIDTTARILHKIQLSLPSDDHAIGIEPLIMNIKYRLGTHRSEEPA